MTPSQRARRRKRRPRRMPRQHYTVDTYGRAITRACERAFPFPFPENLAEDKLEKWISEHQDEIKLWRKNHHWHPNQLRHTKGTEIRRARDLDTARATLGHRSAGITAIYAELDQEKARQAMLELG